MSGSGTSGGSELHLESGVHLLVVVDHIVHVHVLHVLDVDLLLLLPGHHLGLLPLLGCEGLSPGVVGCPHGRQVKARDSGRVRDC